MARQAHPDDVNVTVGFVLEGAFKAAINAHRLIVAANRDFGANDFAGALERAVISREEIGKSRVLGNAAAEIQLGKPITFGELRSRLTAVHKSKQKEGMYGLTFSVETDHPLSLALAARRVQQPGTQAYLDADKEVERISRQMIDEAPGQFHDSRMRALYVDPLNASTWSGPESVFQVQAWAATQAASNDYLAHRSRMTSDADLTDPGLAAAIAAWSGQSDLPLPPLDTLPPPP